MKLLSLVIAAALFLWLAEKPDQLRESLPFSDRGDFQEAEKILRQPFTFLSSGGQTDVYASKDGRYVLKFFKNTPRPWIPSQGYRSRKLRKLHRDTAAYALAFDRLQKETGLVFLHFEKSEKMPSVSIPGRRIPLCSIPFVLQKRGTSLAEWITPENGQTLFEAVSQLVAKRASQGIGDDDPRLEQNIGFLDGTPFFLDPGRFVEDPLKQETLPERFIQWFEKSPSSS